jgi:hypothetical protein
MSIVEKTLPFYILEDFRVRRFLQIDELPVSDSSSSGGVIDPFDFPALADRQSRRHGDFAVRPEHLLLAMMDPKGDSGIDTFNFFYDHGIRLDAVYHRLSDLMEESLMPLRARVWHGADDDEPVYIPRRMCLLSDPVVITVLVKNLTKTMALLHAITGETVLSESLFRATVALPGFSDTKVHVIQSALAPTSDQEVSFTVPPAVLRHIDSLESEGIGPWERCEVLDRGSGRSCRIIDENGHRWVINT